MKSFQTFYVTLTFLYEVLCELALKNEKFAVTAKI